MLSRRYDWKCFNVGEKENLRSLCCHIHTGITAGQHEKLLACWESTEARERVERALSPALFATVLGRDNAAEVSRCREGSSV